MLSHEEMLKELFEEMTEGGLHLDNWEEGFINDVYETVWEKDWEMTFPQEDKVEEIYDKYLG